MPIKFSCPNCKKGLSVKDHLAGKRAACPACKKPLTIPKAGSSTSHAALPAAPARTAPPAARVTAAPAIDAESTAAAAFADAASAAPKEVRTVDFNCPFCDEELKLDAELAGKQTSCPSCRRIIKVPELANEGPKDWRKTAKAGPSAAKGPEVEVPEGAWGASAAQHVSRDALMEAAVLPDRKLIPLTTRQKVTRGITVGVGVLSFLVAGYIGYRWIFGSGEQRALNNVIAFADSDAGRDKVGREGVAVLDLATGEYQLQTKKDTSAAEAKKQFEKALKQLTGGDGSGGDGGGVLIDLAAAAAGLVGTKEQASDGLRLDDKESQKLLRAVLEAIRKPEARLEALRLVSRRLIAEHQAQRAVSLAGQVFSDPAEQGEAVAVVGLELYAAGEFDLAGKAADQALAAFAAAEGQAPPPAPVAVVALAQILKRSEPRADEEDIKTGRAVVRAREGRFDDARKEASGVEAGSARLRAYLAATGETTPDRQAAEDAIRQIPDALKGADRAKLSWTLLHLVRVGAQAGVDNGMLRQAVDAIPEPALRARGHLLILRGRLARGNELVGDDALTAIDAKTAAQLQARVDLARHNIRASGGYAKTVRGWEELYRPFGVIGTMLK